MSKSEAARHHALGLGHPFYDESDPPFDASPEPPWPDGYGARRKADLEMARRHWGRRLTDREQRIQERRSHDRRQPAS